MIYPNAIFSRGFERIDCICWEPIKPVSKTFYRKNKKFHLEDQIDIYKTEYLNKTTNINMSKSYGIAFISGDDYSFYQVTKSSEFFNWEKLYSQTVSLAKKHNKWGQSALRFSRFQKESEYNYIKIISEKLIGIFKKLLINKLLIVGNGLKKRITK